MNQEASGREEQLNISTNQDRFLEAYSLARRAGQVTASWATHWCGILWDREDLVQEALIGVWTALPRFDPARASLRTFVERVVANRITSLVRSARSRRTRRFGRKSLQGVLEIGTTGDHVDLRTDIRRILRRLSTFDRAVALHLAEYSAVETSRQLNVSRAAVYRAIARLRIAFIEAGISSSGTALPIHRRSNCIRPGPRAGGQGRIA